MKQVKMNYLYKAGFTLSELLISLSVLGLISALTLPTVFNSVKTTKDEALFRETFNVIVNVANTGYMEGSFTDAASVFNYLRVKLNSVSYCPQGADEPAKPCNITNRADRTFYHRFTLPTGVTIATRGAPDSNGQSSSKLTSFVVYLDAKNMPAPATGDVWIGFNFDTIPLTSTECGTSSWRPGELRPYGCDQSQFERLSGLS